MRQRGSTGERYQRRPGGTRRIVARAGGAAPLPEERSLQAGNRVAPRPTPESAAVERDEVSLQGSDGRNSRALLAGGTPRCWSTRQRDIEGGVPLVLDGRVFDLDMASSRTGVLLHNGEVARWGRDFLGSLHAGWDDNPIPPPRAPGEQTIVAFNAPAEQIAANGSMIRALLVRGDVQCVAPSLSQFMNLGGARVSQLRACPGSPGSGFGPSAR